MTRAFCRCLLLGAFIGTEAVASELEVKSSESLLNHCKAAVRFVEGQQASRAEAVACLAYVQGLRDALTTGNALLGEVCIPPAVTGGELARLMVEHFEQQPRRIHESRVFGVGVALLHAYPCRK